MLTCSCTCAASWAVPLHRVILSVMTTPPPRSPSVDELPAVVARFLVALPMSFIDVVIACASSRPESPRIVRISVMVPLPPLPGLRCSLRSSCCLSLRSAVVRRARARRARAARAGHACCVSVGSGLSHCPASERVVLGSTCHSGTCSCLVGICSAHVSTIFRLGVTKRSLA